MKKTVAILSGLTYPVPPLRGGGPQIVLYNTCLNLSDPEIEWYVLANWEPGLEQMGYDRDKIFPIRTTWADLLILRLVNLLPYRIRKSIFSEVGDQERLLLNIKIIRRLLLAKKDVLVCHESYPLTYLLHLFFRNKKIVSYTHNSKVHNDFSNAMWERFCKASTAGMVFGAQAAWTDIRKKFRQLPVKTWIIHNGVDIHQYNLTARMRCRVSTRKKLNLKDEDFVFLYCGRITPLKKLDLVISSFLELSKSSPHIKLVILGSAAHDDHGDISYENELHRMIPDEHREKVFFSGFIPHAELPEMYSIADCGVLGTKSPLETVTLFLLECLACGIPVIAAAVGGIPEVVRNGREGFLLGRDYTREDMRLAMEQMIEHQETWARKACEIEKYVQANFSWERVAQEFTDILCEI